MPNMATCRTQSRGMWVKSSVASSSKTARISASSSLDVRLRPTSSDPCTDRFGCLAEGRPTAGR